MLYVRYLCGIEAKKELSMLPIDPKKIQRNYRAVDEFIQTIMRGRLCLRTCYGCKQKWRLTETKFVHTAQRRDKQGSIWICDGCLKKLDDE